MEAVVVVRIVPAQRLGRYVALLVGVGQVGDGLDRRLAHLGVVGVQPTIRRDHIAPVGDHEGLEQAVTVVWPDRRDLQAKRVNLAHALAPEFLLRRLEEIPERIPRLGRVRQFQAGLLDQAAPNVERDAGLLDRREIVAVGFCSLVIESRAFPGRLRKLRFVGLNDVTDIDQLIVPRVLRNDGLGRVHENQIGDIASGQRRDCLLVLRQERHDAVVERIAACLHIVRGQLLERFVLRLHEPLVDPDGRRRSGSIGNIRSTHCGRGSESKRAAQHRSPAILVHFHHPPVRAPFEGAPNFVGMM